MREKKMKKKYKWVIYKRKGNKFGFQLLGFNILKRIELCADLLAFGLISVEADEILQDKKEIKK